ncbi:MAG TPA: hypothetical protein VF111_03915 [Thermoanaerobaculia bacterium]
MSDFLESLVLRAAGFPLTASAAPRVDSAPPDEAGEMEPAEEEEQAATRGVWASSPPLVPSPVTPAQGGREAHTTRGEAVEPREAAPDVDTRTVSDDDRAPLQAQPPLPVAPRPAAPPPPIVERETIVEHAPPPERPAIPAAQLTPQPAPPPIELPRERIIEREHETTIRDVAEDAPAAPPVILQPIVVDQTRTIVEPTREEHTIIETRTERIRDEQPPETEHETEREAAPPPRTVVEPRIIEEHHHEQRAAEKEGDERGTPPQATADAQHESEPPRTLVLPPPPAPQPQAEERESAPQPELQIHIGTIEIRAASPPPRPAPAPQPVIVPRAPEAPPNFDDYAAVRGYSFPDVWR